VEILKGTTGYSTAKNVVDRTSAPPIEKGLLRPPSGGGDKEKVNRIAEDDLCLCSAQTAKEEVQALRRQARNRELSRKVIGIARELGDCTLKRHGAHHVYSTIVSYGGQKWCLTVWWDDSGGSHSVTWGGRKVYGCSPGVVEKYRPDIEGWEEALDHIFEFEVKPKLEQREADAQRRRAERLFEDWGIQMEAP
jgi:hypothetical protein